MMLCKEHETAAVVIFVPPGQFDPHASRCQDHCDQYGWHVEGITRDQDAAVAMLTAGTVDKIVVSRTDHLDLHKLPGVEIAGDGPEPPGARRPDQRRPRRLR